MLAIFAIITLFTCALTTAALLAAGTLMLAVIVGESWIKWEK
jgi:hypothetical protein